MDEEKKKLKILNELSEDFNPRQMYLYKINKAIYYYSTENRINAIEYFEDVLLLVDDIIIRSLGKSRIELYDWFSLYC